MKVIFFGTPEFAVPTLRALPGCGHDVLWVCTRPDRAQGRSGRPLPPPVKREAESRGWPVRQPESVRGGQFVESVRAEGADILVVVAYGRIFPPDLLSAARLGSVNLHASLLPRWRGPAPIQWAIASGDALTGVTTMRMAEGCDTGPILLQREVAVGEEETAELLSPRLAEAGASLMMETLSALERGAIEERPQKEREATRAPMLRHEDGEADWSLPARDLYNRWRGFQPWPGLYCWITGRRVLLERVRVLAGGTGPAGASPGVLWCPARGRAAVACGQGSALELLEVRPEGRRTLSVPDALNGRLLAEGMICGSADARARTGRER